MSRQLTPQQINSFITSHNNSRANVDPKAANTIPQLTWSDDLAAQASQWAEQCTFGHSGRPGVGENIYVTTNPTSAPIRFDPQQAVASWDAEKQYYNYRDNTCEPGKTCGHYTQVVWADTNKVGCAVQNCPVLKNNPFTQSYPGYTLAVCQYTPPGNYVGQRPYIAASSQPNTNAPSTNIQTLQPAMDRIQPTTRTNSRGQHAEVTPYQRLNQRSRYGSW